MPVSVRRHVLDLAYHGPAESANDARAASGASIAHAQLSLGIRFQFFYLRHLPPLGEVWSVSGEHVWPAFARPVPSLHTRS